jgi:hypothetical protein
MALFDRSGARVTVAPEVVRTRQTVTATATVDRPLDKVRSARLEWGYDNYFRYHWAGRADSAAKAGNDSLLMAGQVGTNYGSERDTAEWVCVTRVDVPVATGEFTGATSTFAIPSWAPGSSPVLARWACRLVVERGGIDVDERGVFGVTIGASDVDATDEAAAPIEHYTGSRATDVDIVLASPVWVAGQPITGHLVLRPKEQVPQGEIAVYWQRHREHHPIERYPAQGGALDGPPTFLGKKVNLSPGGEYGMPFTLPLPADAAPSGTSVNSTVTWQVGARIFYAGFTQHQIERVRRPIVVVNAV